MRLADGGCGCCDTGALMVMDQKTEIAARSDRLLDVWGS